MTEFEELPPSIEGKLHAHRHVLAALVAMVTDPSSKNLARIQSLVSRDAVAADQAEDPGSTPDPAFAIVSSEAEELRLLAKEVSRILEGSKSRQSDG